MALLQQLFTCQKTSQRPQGSLLDALLRRWRHKEHAREAALEHDRSRLDTAVEEEARDSCSEGMAAARTAEEGIRDLIIYLDEMMDIVRQCAEGSIAIKTARKEFRERASLIRARIRRTQYKGISLLDSAKWSEDERLSPGQGNTMSLAFDTDDQQRRMVLTDLSYLIYAPSLHQNLALLKQEEFAALLTDLAILAESLNMFARSYAAFASNQHKVGREVSGPKLRLHSRQLAS